MSEISCNSSDLSTEGYSKLSLLAGAKNQIASNMLIGNQPAITEARKLIDSINASNKDNACGASKEQWTALLTEAEKNGASQAVAPIEAQGSKPSESETQDIAPLSVRAQRAMESKLGQLNSVNSKKYLGTWQEIYAKAPSSEPTDLTDIGDAINQSREFNQKLIAALQFEYNQNTTTLPIGWFSNMPGWFPALSPDHNFNKEGYQGLYGINAKRKYLRDAMEGLAVAWENAETSTPGALVNLMASLAKWALPVFGSAALLLFAGKVGLNVIKDGFKKPGIGEAAGWSAGKTWDGTKWVWGKAVAITTFGAVKLKGKKESAKAGLVDTPAYTSDEWAKERVRLEETTRRMIYMDSGRHPRHNPSATPTEILHDVENIPALKTAFDDRMTKLTELGNTLMGQEKYLTKTDFDKEVSKIVAGDIEKPTLGTKIKRKIPLTAENNEYKQTQAALKKVKGEIDAMRARLSAKATMDGIDIPKALEAQLKAFEDAYKAAYEADLNLDRSRNQIVKTGERINAINEVIAHFEEINALEGKIIAKKAEIATVEARIAAQRNAAHTESEGERRTRELQGADDEIRTAKEVLDQARLDQTKLEGEIKDAKKDIKIAQDRIDEREKELKDAIAIREKELKDAIAIREKELKDAIAKSVSSQEAANTDEVAKRDSWNKELRREEGDLKKLSNELSGDDINLKSLNNELNTRTGELKKRDDAKTDATDKVTDLEEKKPAAAQGVADALSEHKTKTGEKTAILSRASGVDAKSLTTADQADLENLKTDKSGLDTKIKDAKAKIDGLAVKPENRGFPRSTGGTLAQAQLEFARLECLIDTSPAGLGQLIVDKQLRKAARDTAFTHMNTTITTLNIESARLGDGLDIKIPHIGEFVKGQGFADELSMRENRITGEGKATDHKLKGSRPLAVKTVITGGRH